MKKQKTKEKENMQLPNNNCLFPNSSNDYEFNQNKDSNKAKSTMLILEDFLKKDRNLFNSGSNNER